MHLLAGSPFAPDAASDWWNFAVNVLIGVATLVTLMVSLFQARLALREAKQATRIAERAALREQQRDQRESERERQLELEGLRRRAARQALSVWATTDWDRNRGLYFEAVVVNDSDAVIRDLRVIWEHDGQTREWEKPWCAAHKGGGISGQLSASGYGLNEGDEMRLTFEFTDAAADRWRLYPDRRIELINERTFVTRQ